MIDEIRKAEERRKTAVGVFVIVVLLLFFVCSTVNFFMSRSTTNLALETMESQQIKIAILENQVNKRDHQIDLLEAELREVNSDFEAFKREGSHETSTSGGVY